MSDIDYSRYRILPLHAIHSPLDPRDFRWLAAEPNKDIKALPSQVLLDEQGLAGPILDQGAEGSCSGHAESAMMTHLDLKNGQPLLVYSRAFPYYEARLREGMQNQDSGAYIRDGLDVLLQMGDCADATMPYVPGQFTTPPSAQAIAEALGHKITSYKQLVNVADVYNLMAAENRGVIIGTYFYQEWYNPRGGVFPEPASQPIGGHAMFCCGYKWMLNPWTNQQQCMIRCHNSWGVGFGDAGHVYLPIDTFDQHVFERWTVYKDPPPNPEPSPSPFPQDLLNAAKGAFGDLVNLLKRLGLDPHTLLS
jgi:hypothetical protein